MMRQVGGGQGRRGRRAGNGFDDRVRHAEDFRVEFFRVWTPAYAEGGRLRVGGAGAGGGRGARGDARGGYVREECRVGFDVCD